MKKKDSAGFTLIEMMIVVEIIAIMVAIAVPSLRRQKIQTNEAAAVGNLKVVIGAQISYCASKNTYADFADLTSEELGKGTAYLDPSWTNSGLVRSGYQFSMRDVTTDTFLVSAVPIKVGITGINTWYANEGGDIWWEAPS